MSDLLKLLLAVNANWFIVAFSWFIPSLMFDKEVIADI